MLLARFFERDAQVAVVLEIKAVKFGKLTGILGDRSSGGISEFIGYRASQVMRGRFENFVCGEWLCFGCF